MFEKVVKFKSPDKNEDKLQQALFEVEEEYIPKKREVSGTIKKAFLNI